MAKFAKVQNKRIISITPEEVKLTEEERKAGVVTEEVDDDAKVGDEFNEEPDAAS